MMITSRQKRQCLNVSMPDIYINNSVVEEVNEHKVLGVIIDNNLSWSSHILSLSKKLSRKTHLFCKIKNFIDLSARKLFFSAYILSLIDYA